MIMTNAITRILAAAALAAAAGQGLAAEVETRIIDVDFSFEGPFGVYDRAQLQRGYQIYNQVCASCHGMQYVAFRHLGDPKGPGFPEEQVRAFAAQVEFPRDDDPSQMRPGQPFDYFPTPEYFGDGHPPDLSLMAKARAGFHGPYGTGLNQLLRGTGGPEYIYSLMMGYRDAPECAADSDIGGYYNVAFAAGGFPDSCIDEAGHRMAPGSWIAMPEQIYDGLVEYQDGTEATAHQLSMDIAAFLMWSAEPKMMERKEAGLRNFIWLGLLAVLLYFVNKKVWRPVKGDS
jgi:ubiquinol-cytochrome c reductase cytochrome c1 subunit